MAAKFVCGSALAVLASAGCIDDLEGVVKDCTATAVAIKGLVSDCRGDDRSKCQDDVGALLDSLDQLQKDIAPCTTSCGTHGPDCVAAINKLGDDIGAIKEPAKDMADKCAGKDKSTMSCIFDGIKVGTDAAKVLSDVHSTITLCKKGDITATSVQDYEQEWKDFKAKYEKSYDDEEKRFGVFKSNLDFISETNAQSLSYTLAVNEFADLTWDEFKEGHFGVQQPSKVWADLPHLGNHNYSGSAAPASVDWVSKGAVTKVKNQARCGSCWSFSTTGAIEGAWYLATKKLVPLSEQQFVDCDKVDHGCHGGLMDNAFGYAKKNALCTEESYAYEGKADWFCYTSKCTVAIPKGGVIGFQDVKHNDMAAMMDAVSKQPVSIAIEADKPAFALYHGGILTGDCGHKLDHGVLAVGYGTDGGKDYWKIKNSWGPKWGEKGFFRIFRGKAGPGECGILMSASYPVVQSAEIVV